MKKPFKRYPDHKKNQDNYKCRKCGFVFSKKDSPVSGWEDHPNGFHVHCPQCNSVVGLFLKKEDK